MRGLGTVRSVSTLEQVVLGQCEVSQHLSERCWDSTKCTNTRTKVPGTVRSVPTLEQGGLGTVQTSRVSD